jgi:predicted membrane protein
MIPLVRHNKAAMLGLSALSFLLALATALLVIFSPK